MRMWPRGLRTVVRGDADTEADVRAYTSYPRREQQANNIELDVNVSEAAVTPARQDRPTGEPTRPTGARAPSAPDVP
jgi:hypothetical protein